MFNNKSIFYYFANKKLIRRLLKKILNTKTTFVKQLLSNYLKKVLMLKVTQFPKNLPLRKSKQPVGI